MGRLPSSARPGTSDWPPGLAPAGALNRSILNELSDVLFTELHRSDQRVKAAHYLRGLITVEGRKSVRNIASCVGGPELAQSLHHFIADSPWDWEPVSRALRRYADNELRFAAWVVQSQQVPRKSRQAIGVWGVARDVTAPVKWSLLPSGNRAAECVAAAGVGSDHRTIGPRPVILDLPGIDPLPLFDRYMQAGEPLLSCVPVGLPVTAQESGPAHRSVPAARLLQMNRMLRRLVEWTDPATGVVRRSLVAGVRVEWADHPLLLLGQWDSGQGQPVRCWLTNLTATPLGVLLRLAKFTQRTAQDFTTSAPHVGTLDYEGRSSDGWHRHMTLAAAAHVAQTVAAVRARVRPWSQCMDSMERMSFPA
ncbi:transposase [Streptomyces violascens]|uniref:ISXo8 transposase n=1 Tax=Streptomyces violascens TaxID=67381 RepID=A0ABQ3R283_9ACTN|nr:transposase [Streptomyces violascens]GGU32406.1 putative ISXo8 transposase [Streptomyces violascens]GHI43636.1 putative ISXo8 transposase [Streptomyces violascens]